MTHQPDCHCADCMKDRDVRRGEILEMILKEIKRLGALLEAQLQKGVTP